MPGHVRRALHVAEPPARFRVRPPVVVDCSVLAAALFIESDGELACRRLEGMALHAPHLIDVELASVALKKTGSGEAALVAAGLERYASLDIERHPVAASTVLELASRYRLTAYDAAYLQLAAALRAPLITFDERLAKAAEKHLGSLP